MYIICLYLHFVSLFCVVICTHLYDIKYSYNIQMYTQLYGFKYSSLRQIIFKQILLTNRCLTGAITSHKIEPWSNGNE